MNKDQVDPAREILYINFNQSSTALSVGTKNGYMVYDLDQVHECRPTYESRNVEDVCIVERNFLTSLIAYVSLHSPRKLIVYNYKKGEEVFNKQFANTVLSVKLNRKYAVVCLEDSIFIRLLMGSLCHKTSVSQPNDQIMESKKTHTITDIPPNLKGLCALTHGNDDYSSLLAYPGSNVAGDVQIFDAATFLTKNTIPAHHSPLAALAFSEDGTKLATASVKGTVIRVFSTASGQILFEFRRGISRCVQIHSLSFSNDGDFLSASSNTETVHIFKLCVPEDTDRVDEEVGWIEMVGRAFTLSAKYLPSQMSNMLTQQRSFATVHLPFVGHGNICAVTKIQRTSYVVVASLEGFLYIYKLNTEAGGPCLLIKQHRLEGPLMSSSVNSSLSNTVACSVNRTIKSSLENRIPPSLGLLCDPAPYLEPNVFDSKTKLEDDVNETCDQFPNKHIQLPYDSDLPPLLNKVE